MNEDILHLILEHFELQPCPLNTRKTRRKCLFSAAKACKSFLEPAPNQHWRVLPSLLPLLLLLPSAEVSDNQYFANLRYMHTESEFSTCRIVIPPGIYLRIRSLEGHLKLNVVELVLNGTKNVSLGAVNTFTSLQRLQIRLCDKYLCPQIIQRLGNLLNLLDLTLSLEAYMLSVIEAHPPTFVSSNYANFPGPGKSHITEAPSLLTRVLDDITMASLVTLVIRGTFGDTGERSAAIWKRLLNQVSVCLAIEDTEIDDQYWEASEACSMPPSTWFLPFLNLKKVKKLVLYNVALLPASDDDYHRIARAFPRSRRSLYPLHMIIARWDGSQH